MATRNENLNRIRNAMGSYSPGSKNITQMNGPRYEETSRDESLRILQSALSGGSTAGTTPQSGQPYRLPAPLTQGSLTPHPALSRHLPLKGKAGARQAAAEAESGGRTPVPTCKGSLMLWMKPPPM